MHYKGWLAVQDVRGRAPHPSRRAGLIVPSTYGQYPMAYCVQIRDSASPWWHVLQVQHVPRGLFVNASEETAFKRVAAHLPQVPGDRACAVLTNLMHASPRGQADEVDMVMAGSGGAIVIEVRHWDRSSLRGMRDVSELLVHRTLTLANIRVRADGEEAWPAIGCWKDQGSRPPADRRRSRYHPGCISLQRARNG